MEMCGGLKANAVNMSCSSSCGVWPGNAYMMSRLEGSNDAAASSTAAKAWLRSCTRPRALRCWSLKLCTPTDSRVTPAARKARKRSFSNVPGLASKVISQSGARSRRARMSPISRSIQAGRAAADEDAVHRAAPDEGQRGFQVGHQRVDVALLGHPCIARRIAATFAVLMRVEVAVRAFLEAPRQVPQE